MPPIPLLNTGLLLGLLLSTASLFFFTPGQDVEETLPPLPKKVELPPSPFKAEPAAYERISGGPLTLVSKPPVCELPDLKEELLFFGKNGRPDVKEGKTLFHLGLKSSNAIRTAEGGEKSYLIYNKGIYSFSPDNLPTSLWIETSLSDGWNGEMLNVVVAMQGKEGVITSPESCHLFTLRASEVKTATNWELPGGIRVDPSLLARQRARYVGPDVFLQQHGGPEFAYTTSRDRIDFIENETIYSCFVKEGDFLIWKEGRWQTPQEDEETTRYPLLALRKVEDKALHFDLWEAQGKGKVSMNLVKIKMHEGMPELTQEFKFVGAKTWSQFIVECRGERLLLRPGDWLVLGLEGWKKMETAIEIDDYVNQVTIGPLFVLEKMTKKEGRSLLIGHLYNTSRTEMKEIELGNTEPKGSVKS